MADTMSPPPPPSHRGRRFQRHRRHREGFSFTESDMAAAHQLIQLSDDSDDYEDRRKSAKNGSSSVVDREVTSVRIEEIFGRERGDRGGREGFCQPRKKRYRSIAEIYAVTKPIELRRTSSHHNVIR